MLYIIFFLVWIILNAKISLEVIIFGIVIASVMFWFMCKFMDHSIKKEFKYMRLAPWLFVFFVLLIWEIIKANFSVMRTIIMDEYEVEPEIVHFKTTLDDEFCQVLLANAITLTPGTITVHFQKGVYTVHCLDKEMANGIENSSFIKITSKINRIKNK